MNDCRAYCISHTTASISVGYHNNETKAKQGSFGPVFKQVGTDGSSYKLKDFKAIGMSDSGGDFIQFLEADTASTILRAVYLGAEYEEYEGWWDNSIENQIDDQEFAAGTGFLCLFPSGNTVTFECAGEVEAGRTISTEDVENKGHGKKQPFIANPLPVDLKLGHITAEGMSDSGGDFIQFLNDTEAATYIRATYLGSEYEEYEGWWDNTISTSLQDTPVPAGAAFLGLFPSLNVVTFVFPDPLNLPEVKVHPAM